MEEVAGHEVSVLVLQIAAVWGRQVEAEVCSRPHMAWDEAVG